MKRSLRIRVYVFVLATGSACFAHPQAVPAGPAFEVATVRPAKPDAAGSNFNYHGSEIQFQNLRLIDLLKYAWGLGSSADKQIEGMPDWASTARFDINAKLDDATTALPFSRREKASAPMLLQLLKDRFHLQYRTELQPRHVLALVVSKKGSKLQAFTACDVYEERACPGQTRQGLHNDGLGHIEAVGMPVSSLVAILASQPDIDGRLVADDTGLKGKYNFEVHYSPDAGRGEAGSGPSLFSALQEQLGLKLETKTLPVQIYTVTHVEPPTGN